MGRIERMTSYWKCVPCAHEWIIQDENKLPQACPSCKSPDWFAGNGSGKQKKATIVRPVGKQRVMQQSGKTVLRIVKRVEATLAAAQRGNDERG